MAATKKAVARKSKLVHAARESDSEAEKLVKKKKPTVVETVVDKDEAAEAELSPTVLATPKLFFHSKRNKAVTPTPSSHNESKTIYSPFLNTPQKAPLSTAGACLAAADPAASNGTPNGKKFRLLKCIKSSSSEEESGEEAHEPKAAPASAVVEPVVEPPVVEPVVEPPVVESIKEPVVEQAAKPVKEKRVSIKIPDESNDSDGNQLNVPSDSSSTTKRARSSRLSLENSRGSSTAPKIMTTGIMLTDKEKKVLFYFFFL